MGAGTRASRLKKQTPATTDRRRTLEGGTSCLLSRRLILTASAGALLGDRSRRRPRRRKRSTTKAPSDTEIRIGNTMPYSGNASAYGNIGRTIEAVFKMVNDNGGINGRKVNFITYDDGYCAAEDGRDGAEAGRGRQSPLPLQHAWHAAEHGDPQVHERQEGAAAVRGDRRLEVGPAQRVPVDDGLAARLRRPKVRSTPSTFWRRSRMPKIGVLMQNDDYGKDYFNGFKAGLGKDNEKHDRAARRPTRSPTRPSTAR